MRFSDLKFFFSLFLFIFIAGCAWPVYVASSLAMSHFTDMLGIIDFIDTRPKRMLVSEFIDGWLKSAPIACALGVLAVVDMQLLIRNRFTYYLAGLSLPVVLIAITLVFFKQYGFELVPTFALTGVVLWLMYRVLELASRFELG